MENGLEDQVSMFQKVQGGLEANKVEIAVIPVMVEYQKELDTRVENILVLASKSNTDITGFTVDKQFKRNDMTDKIRRLSTATVAFAAVNDNRGLMEKCDATLSELNSMRDNDFYAYSKLLIDEVAPILPQLAPFGIKKDQLDEATKAMDLYLSTIQNPRIKISERGRYIDELEESINSTSVFLREKMDKVMDIFSVTNPGLHKEYLGYRGIDGTGNVNTPDYNGTVMPGGMELIAEIAYLSARTFDLKNVGGVAIEFALSRTPLKMEGNIKVVEKGLAELVKTSDFNLDTGATKLYARNPGTEPAEYKVWIIE